jgi:hypothetical protein
LLKAVSKSTLACKTCCNFITALLVIYFQVLLYFLTSLLYFSLAGFRFILSTIVL